MRNSLILLSFLATTGCAGSKAPPATGTRSPTAAEAQAFVTRADAALREAWVARESAWWTYSTDITDAHAEAAAAADERAMAVQSALVAESVAYAKIPELDPEIARQIHLLRVSTALPAPTDPERRGELATLSSKLSGLYGTGKYCTEAEGCRSLGELSQVLSASRDPAELLDAWSGWRTVSPAMRDPYTRFVELGNEGARDLGFTDLGELWRAGYDMPPADVPTEADRLWEQVRPLYEQLHCHVRAKLSEAHGPEVAPATGPIPAHLLGNMWAQEWADIYPMVTPYPSATSVDVTAAIVEKGWDEREMTRVAEGFFTSLGLQSLPDTFWERSMFVKPDDREVECHASAWDVLWEGDVRIKMCVQRNAEDFRTLHHELGHDYYFLYYKDLPVLFQSGAHDGFHEAIGDVLALSITPEYLAEVGLTAETARTPEAVVNDQMQVALQKIAFLPFGRMIDQWRWDVFAGRTTPETYNADWWTLRERYQGVSAPIARSEADFDPGAKYHIPANTPYLRYFFAAILQFQMYESLCRTAGHEGPLHTCTLYGSEAAGEKLAALLSMGASRPWPDALEVVTGTRQMDATPLVTYFDPLMVWLQEQNEGRTCGW